MAITAQRLQVEVTADTKAAERGLGRLSAEGRKTPVWAKAAMGAVVGFGAAGVAALGGSIIGAASDLNETLAKTGVVFGPQTKAVTGFAQDMADSFGLPKTAILDATSQFGLLGKAAGLSGGPLSGMSTGLAQLAADASSFYNVPLEQALGDFSSALSGESEPVKKYGVLMNETAVQAEAVALGIAKQGEALSEGQKVQARASLITKGLADAQGDLARTQDSVSNRMRELRGRVTNLAAGMGTALLPAVAGVLGGLNGFVAAIPGIVSAVKAWVAENGALLAVIGKVVVVVAGFVAGLLAVMGAQQVVALISRIRAGILLMNAALLANPIGLVVGALAALAVGVYLAYQRFAPFRDLVNSVGGYLKGLYDQVMASFTAWGGMERVLGIASAALSTIGGWLVMARDYLGGFIARVREFITSADLGAAFANIGTALQGFLPLFGQLQVLAGQVWGVLQQLWTVVTNNKAVFLALAGAIALVVAPIPTLIAAFIAAYTQVEGFRTVVNAVVTFIVGTVIPALISLVSGGISLVVSAVSGLISAWQAAAPAVMGVVAGISGAVSQFVGWLDGLWQQFWGRFGTPIKVAMTLIVGLIRTNLQVALTVVRTVLAAIGTVISAGMAVARQVFSVAWSAISQIVGTAINVVKSLLTGGMGVIKNVVELAMNVLTGNWRGAWNNLKGIFSSAWSGISGAVRAGISGLLGLIRTIPGQASSALGNIGSILYNKGRDLIAGLANGIRSAVGQVTSAVSSVTSRIRGFLPGSPIKEGPLKDWNRGGAGRRLGALLARGIRESERDVARATARLARGAAMGDTRVGRRGVQTGVSGVYRARMDPDRTARVAASRTAAAARVVNMNFVTYYPINEPQSQTTNRALQRVGALSME